MFKKYKNSIEVFHFDHLSQFDNIVQFVSTRKGGESQSPYDSLNLGLNSGDNPIKVIKNRELLAETLGFNGDCLITCRQVHGNKVRVITIETVREEQSHKGRSKIDADAMITNLPNFCLTVIVADCVPILFFDPETATIAAVHAGWKGTVKKIAHKTLTTMIDEFGARASNIIAGIGPSIGPCCYEIKDDVISELKKALNNHDKFLIEDKVDNHFYLDLWEANKQQLIEVGVSEKNIETSLLCTKCNPEQFFSYRDQGHKYGRQAAGIMLKD